MSDPKAILKVFREPDRDGAAGRPRLVRWPNLLLAPVVKQAEEGRVVGIARKIEQGTQDAVAQVSERRPGRGGINTAFIERLKATFGEPLASLVRRGRALARESETLQRFSHECVGEIVISPVSIE